MKKFYALLCLVLLFTVSTLVIVQQARADAQEDAENAGCVAYAAGLDCIDDLVEVRAVLDAAESRLAGDLTTLVGLSFVMDPGDWADACALVELANEFLYGPVSEGHSAEAWYQLAVDAYADADPWMYNGIEGYPIVGYEYDMAQGYWALASGAAAIATGYYGTCENNIGYCYGQINLADAAMDFLEVIFAGY